MVVNAIGGSDSGFGIGTDGIGDDYDDETGISVILWCVIFIFLLIITVWFYITQLMPNRTAKCEVDEDDEDERVANRLFDQLGTKTTDKSYDEHSTCEPSTSREEDYEVIDGEITIHYTNYEREPNDHDNNACPTETQTILRRPSMEEMSLIFPGFLPSITEEEEFEEINHEGNVYRCDNNGSDTIESNVNIFIEQESQKEYKFDHEEEVEVIQLENGNVNRVSTNRKGKQPVGSASTDIRRRHFHKETQPNGSTPRETNTDNVSYVRDSEHETAVIGHTSNAHNSLKFEQIPQTLNDNKKQHIFISGSENNCDPEDQTTTSDISSDPLIIIEESTVALTTLSSDANENMNQSRIESNYRDTPPEYSESTCSTSFADKSIKEKQVCGRKSREIVEEVKPEETNDIVSCSKRDDLVLSSKKNSSITMVDQLTHSWTFYAMSDTNNINENHLEAFHRTNDQQDIPEIVVDFYQDEKHPNCNSVEHFPQENVALDSFETDIDVDDIDLDELVDDGDAESDFNCFVKRHVSVTDLDKILSSHEITNDGTKEYMNEMKKENDLDEIVRGITKPVGKINKEGSKELPNATGDQKTMNEPQISSHRALTGALVQSKMTITLNRIPNDKKHTSKKSEILNENPIKSTQNFQLKNTQQDSNDDVDTASKNTESKRDFEDRNFDKNRLAKRSEAESDINTINKDTDNDNITVNESNSSDGEEKRTKTTKVEIKKGVYSYKSKPDKAVQETMTEQEDNYCNSSCVDVSPSNVEDTVQSDKTFLRSNANDTTISDKDGNKDEPRILSKRVSSERSSIKEVSTEKSMGLTAEELKSKIDLTRPFHSTSRDEVIIGIKKNKKDGGTRIITTVTPGNASETSRKSSESSRYSSKWSTEQTVASRSVSEYNFVTRSTSNKTVTSRNAIEKTDRKTVVSKDTREHDITSRNTREHDITSRNTAVQMERSRDTDPNLSYHIEKREVQQQPTIKKSVVLDPETSKLQTLITIKDLPDSNLGVHIATTTPFDVTKPKKTSTGLEKAEQIVAGRLKRLEQEKCNGNVRENVTCIASKSRQIDWENFLVDGLVLEDVDSTKKKTREIVHDNVVLTPPPPPVRKSIVLNNDVKVTENYTTQSLCPREINWDWFEHDDEKSPKIKDKDKTSFSSFDKKLENSIELKNKDNSTHDVNDNVKKGTEAFMDEFCANYENSVYENKNKKNDVIDFKERVVLTDSLKDKNEHHRNDNSTAGVSSTTEEEKLPLKHEDFSDDNDVFSFPSYPSSEPEFPVRLTKSFSELRNVEMISQPRVEDSKFNPPDRSKSQTDVFAPQGSQDDVFTDSEDHIFNTRITVDEVYKNRRRIVILNVRKKAPGKARWNSLSDLDSAKKHVFRYSSSSSAGGDLSLSTENNGNDKVLVSSSRESNHSNHANTDIPPSCKQTVNQTMEKTEEDFDLTPQSQPNRLDLQESTFATIEQSLQKEDLPSKDTSDVDGSASLLASNGIQPETVEPKLCESVESQRNVFKDDFISTEEDPRRRVSSPTESEIEMCQLQRDASLSPVRELNKQNTSRRSPATVFAVSRHSPAMLTDSEVENALQRLPSPPSILQDLVKEDINSVTSLPSSGTIYAVSRHSPTPLRGNEISTKHPSQGEELAKDIMSGLRDSSKTFKDSEIERLSCRQSSALKDLNEKDSNRPSFSETLPTVSKDSPTQLRDPENEKSLERQSSLSPDRGMTKRRSPSPSGTIFAISRHSPTPLKDYKGDKSLPRQSSLSPVQDMLKTKSTYGSSSGTIFTVSRHSPTPLLDDERKSLDEKNKPSSPVHFVQPAIDKDNNTTIPPASKKTATTEPQNKESDNKRLVNEDILEKNLSEDKLKEEIPLQRSSPTTTDRYYSSRHSSASSSGYGGSRISPTSLDRRYKYDKSPKPSPSPDLVPEEKRETSSRRSSASSGSVFMSRISPTPSTDSECFNVDERKSPRRHSSQRGSYRVFVISGYSSAASDTESQRPGSVSPRDNEQQHTTKHSTKDKDNKEWRKTEKKEIDRTFLHEHHHKETKRFEDTSKNRPLSKTSEEVADQVKHSIVSSPSSESDIDYKITQDGWLMKGIENNTSSVTHDRSLEERVKRTNDRTLRADDLAPRTNDKASRTDDRASRTNDQVPRTDGRKVIVTDLDSLLSGSNSTTMNSKAPSDEQPDHTRKEVKPDVTARIKSPATTTTPSGVQETDLDAIFADSDSLSEMDKNDGTKIPKVDSIQRSKIIITSMVTSENKHTVQVPCQDAIVCNSSPTYEKPMFNDLDEDVFKVNTKPLSRRENNDMTFSSDADSETSSLNSVPIKPKIKHVKASLDAVKSPHQRLSQSSDSSSATPSTPEKVEPEFMFLHPDLTSTPEVLKTVEITKNPHSMSREATTESSHEVRRDDNAKGNSLLTDSSYGAMQVKTRSKSEIRTISTEAQRSAFTPVRSRTNDRRSISQEFLLDALANEEEATSKSSLKCNALEDPTFEDMADSHKSMPDLHKTHEEDDVYGSPKKTVPYHSRLSAHTRLWLSQTAGIDTSNLCNADESVGSEIFLFPSKRFQPGKNVDASFLSIASEPDDIPDDVSSRPSSPMSEFSFAGDSPFGAEADNELRIITCGHRFCDQEEVIRGQEKTSFTSCPACYTYYCSRECRQANWREHKKSCHFGRINSYMRSFFYFCHKKENLRLLLSNIAAKNYASKGRGCVMVTFASAQQARKFMTGGCVLLPSPPSYPTVRELMREGVVSKHKVNLVHQIKDYDPTKEFVLNLAVVAGKLEDMPRNPVPRHKLSTVLECIKVPLSESVIEQPKTAVPDTTKETRVFYLPKCSRHGFINDMEARRHYCRNISKALKSYGIRLKKDYPEAYESLCQYVEKNIQFKPVTVYGNEGSKIVACRIMPEASISAV